MRKLLLTLVLTGCCVSTETKEEECTYHTSQQQANCLVVWWVCGPEDGSYYGRSGGKVSAYKSHTDVVEWNINQDNRDQVDTEVWEYCK